MAKFEVFYEYLDLHNAAKKLGIELGELIHAGATGQVQICVNLYGDESAQKRTRIFPESSDAGEPTQSDLGLLPAGFFELDPETMRFFEQKSTTSVTLFEARKYDGLGWWDVEFDPQPRISISDLYVLESEITRLTALSSADQSQVTSKPMLTREKNTLLTIIAALAKKAAIDISAPHTGKAAGFIEGLTDTLGAHVSKRAIEEHLKKIPSSIESRLK